MQINKYDTIKDKDGQRYRIVEVSESLGVVKAVKIDMTGGRAVKGGRPRMVKITDINGKDYIKIDLPPVKVTQHEPTPSEKAAEIEKTAVREITKSAPAPTPDNKELEILRAEIKDKVRENIDLKKTISKMQQEHAAEVDELNDQLMEARAVAKKVGEYASALDADSDAFERIEGLIHAARLAIKSADRIFAAAEREMEGKI